MGRKSARLERLGGERLVAYADLLRVTARLADNAMTWSAVPLADLKETDNDELDRLISRVRVVASKHVYSQLGELTRHAHEFNRQLFAAKLHHQRVQNSDSAVHHGWSIKQRMSLGTLADKMLESHERLEATIRKDLKS